MEKKFIRTFTLSFISLVLFILGFTTTIDPERVLGMPWRIDFVSDRNPLSKKKDLLKKANGVEFLILGSSRANNFSPQYVEKITGLKAFNASTAGGGSASKYYFAKEAIKSQPLKTIFYLTDFFEFKKAALPINLAGPNWDSQYQTILSHFDSPSFEEFAQKYFSNQTLEMSFATLKDYIKSTPSSYQANGVSSHKIVPLSSKDLERNIYEIYRRTYQKIYSDYDEIFEGVKQLFIDLVASTKEKNIELIIVMSPFHPTFRKLFEQDSPEKLELYRQWKQFILSLKAPHVQIYDFTSLDSIVAPTQEFWDDGVHFNEKASNQVLKKIFL
jgi:hypothetical protein